MMTRKAFRFSTLFLLLALGSDLFAQQEIGTHFMTGMWQATRTNPALVPDAKVVVALPGLYNSVDLGFSYSDLVRTEGNSQVLDLDFLIEEKLEDENRLQDFLNFDILATSLTFGQLNVHAGWSAHAIAFNEYPKALIQYLWQGNAQFVGQEVEIGPELLGLGYNEFYVGGSYRINDMITAGARFKLLNGFAELSTDPDRSRLTLLSDSAAYALNIDTDYRINTSGQISYNGLDEFDLDFGLDEFSFGSVFSPNWGFGLDLGLQLRLGPFDINASAINLLGTINWNNEVSGLSVSADDTFRGLDIFREILDGEDISFDGLLDTLETILVVDSTQESFSSRLPAQYYLSGVFHLNRTFNFGAAYYMYTFRGKAFPAFGLSAQAVLSKWFQAGVVYSYRNSRWDNLGVNMALSLGPVQLLAATDNVVGMFNAEDAESFNLRLGLNLVFGRNVRARLGGGSSEEEAMPSPEFY